MTHTIGLVAQGEMGTGIGRRLVERGCKVLTVLEGRSVESAKRAAAAGMISVSWKDAADVDIFLSVVPPGEAVTLARQMVPWLKSSTRKPLYVDLNAINPTTVMAIEALITEAGCAFADCGICGGPPDANGHSPMIYASGAGAAEFGALKSYDLDIRVMDAPAGAGSTIKICQAAITKGYTALTSMAVLAAMRFGAGETLKNAVTEMHPNLYEFLHPATFRMFDKAYRYVGEMNEIAQFLENETGGRQAFEAFSALYSSLTEDRRTSNRDVNLLREFYEGPQDKPKKN